jgi:hypothetical protein
MEHEERARRPRSAEGRRLRWIAQLVIFGIGSMSAGGHYASTKIGRAERPKATVETRRRALGRQRMVLGAAPPVPSPIPSAEDGRGLG